MTNPRASKPQPPSVTTDAVNLVLPLIKATLEPAAKRAKRPIDSPAGRIVSQVARRDMDTGGADGTVNLIAGLTSTLSFMAPALAQALGRAPETAGAKLAEALRQQDGNPYMVRVLETVQTTGAAEAVAEAMAGKNGEVYDLILNLADCIATHAEAYAHVTSTPLDEVWAEIEAGLHD